MSRDLEDLCSELAREAGQLVRAGRRKGVGDVTTKSSATDPVTEYDRKAEAHVVSRLRRARPDDGLVGEEGTEHPGTSGLKWLIDPIDGTTNYLYDLPTYSVSVAVADDVGAVAGAVYVPITDEMFHAHRGGGARRDGEPIRCSTCHDLALALVATGFSYKAANRRRQAAQVAELLPRIRDIRRMGSAALDLCFAACGRVDAYYEQWLNPWDSAAGVLIASEAGAVVGSYPGEQGEPDGLLVAPSALYGALSSLLAGTGT